MSAFPSPGNCGSKPLWPWSLRNPATILVLAIVEFSQAELQKSEADIADTDAKYQYRLTQIVLAYTISSPK